jgi:hypothetical protein
MRIEFSTTERCNDASQFNKQWRSASRCKYRTFFWSVQNLKQSRHSSFCLIAILPNRFPKISKKVMVTGHVGMYLLDFSLSLS